MENPFWFNRMVEYWSMPLNLDLVDLVHRGRIQVVQTGTFGPQFYSLADDPDTERHWVGMPLVGVRENLAHIEQVIAGVQDAGALFVGQISMSWHYGDHETGKGLFGVWDDLWTDDLLGPAPCDDPADMLERLADGSLRCWPIEDRPYRTYCGCLSNPYWIAMLKAMVRKAVEVGVDGLMVHHNFTYYCRCAHCRAEARSRFEQTFDSTDLKALFGTDQTEAIEDIFTFRSDCPEAVRRRAEAAIALWEQLRRKEVFDDIYHDYGRSLKPGFMTSQWYHKYDFTPDDERCLLPPELWAREEDYIWYSQGGNKGMSMIEHGYLSDTGLPARFIYAAGGGRPFITNKYDYRRFRLSIAEAGANHAAAPAFHWGDQQEKEGYLLEDYTGPLVRYHRFLADHDNLIRDALPLSQIAMVYPRRAEPVREMDAIDPLKRMGRILEDYHVQFEIIIDDQLEARCRDFEMLILPNVKRMSQEEADGIRQFVAEGGKLVVTDETGVLDEHGQPYDRPLFDDRQAAGQVLHIPTAPWKPEDVAVTPDLTLPLYPLPDQDAFGKAFMNDLRPMLDPPMLLTDAPWFVRVRAWQAKQEHAVVLHWVNYRQDEDSEIEVPLPTDAFEVDLALPPGSRVDCVEWRYPEMREPTVLPHDHRERRLRFTAPGVIVYGLSVVYLTTDQ